MKGVGVAQLLMVNQRPGSSLVRKPVLLARAMVAGWTGSRGSGHGWGLLCAGLGFRGRSGRLGRGAAPALISAGG